MPNQGAESLSDDSAIADGEQSNPAEKQTAQKKAESTSVKRGNLQMAPDDDQKKQNGLAHMLAFMAWLLRGQHHRGGGRCAKYCETAALHGGGYRNWPAVSSKNN